MAAVEQVAPQIVELAPEGDGETEELYIRYRGAELRLPVGTDIDAIASVLRSI